MRAFKEGLGLLVLVVSCLVADVTKILSADLSCAYGLVWSCVSRHVLSLLLDKLQPKTTSATDEEEGEMERYHTKHHDPEAVGHSPEATQVFVPLHRLKTATI